MSLPLDGPLSFSEIGAATGVGAPYSLTQMSANAGFGQPDAVSEFYGYGPGGGLTLFFRSIGYQDEFSICQENPFCCTPAWHNGTGSVPQINDYVYEDAAGTIPLAPFKRSVFFGIETAECGRAFSWIRIDDLGSGQVYDSSGCLLEGPEQPMFQ